MGRVYSRVLSAFVHSTIEEYAKDYPTLHIVDPFAGCGTVLVEAKFCGYPSFGIELNPLLSFITNVKVNSWDISPGTLKRIYESLPRDVIKEAPSFLKSEEQFNPGVLRNLKGFTEGLILLIPKQMRRERLRTSCGSPFPLSW